MREKRPNLQGFERVLDRIAADPRLPPNFPEWIRASLRTSGWKLRILLYILDHSLAGDRHPTVLDVGAQFGSLAIYAAQLECHAAAVDYGPCTNIYRKIGAENGVDYRECNLGAGPLPFPSGDFDFVTYTDVLEHHSFSPKRVLQEIHRVLRPGGQVILLTPNHASIYNRLKLLSGRSVHDDLDYFFDSSSGDTVYDGHHREYTRAEVKIILQRTGFGVKDCRVVEQEWTPLVRYLWRNRAKKQGLPKSRDLLLCALGRIWAPLRLPFGRWIWAVGEKEPRDLTVSL